MTLVLRTHLSAKLADGIRDSRASGLCSKGKARRDGGNRANDVRYPVPALRTLDVENEADVSVPDYFDRPKTGRIDIRQDEWLVQPLLLVGHASPSSSRKNPAPQAVSHGLISAANKIHRLEHYGAAA